jgi:hypothetical protein
VFGLEFISGNPGLFEFELFYECFLMLLCCSDMPQKLTTPALDRCRRRNRRFHSESCDADGPQEVHIDHEYCRLFEWSSQVGLKLL